ncbi:hypothetical protein GCM10020331_062500 [Ectobacillus funiculus]
MDVLVRLTKKVEAAKELGIDIILIGRPVIDYGTVYSEFSDVIQALQKKLAYENKKKE